MIKYDYYVADFETTVFEGQEYTEVWASALVKLHTEDVTIFHSIDDTFNYIISLNKHLIIYYHNLKFDGSFWLSYLLIKKEFKQAYIKNETNTSVQWLADKDMQDNTFKYSISDMGQWYDITLKVNGKYIHFRDSFKLLPFSVKRIGKSFDTKHKKLDMKYEGYRYAGCEITPEEKKYIANDVLVVKEALEIMFNEGHTKLTIGSCCLSEFKKGYDKHEYNVTFFPDISEIELNTDTYKYPNADLYIRKSYKGGWCYVVQGKENKILTNGTTADVNSLYPSMMSSESGNYYPIGKPTFMTGRPPEHMEYRDPYHKRYYYFIRIRTKFKIKKNKLPFMQVKGNVLYPRNKMLTTSDIFDEKLNRYYSKIQDLEGNIQDVKLELTLTCTDYELFKEHYDLIDTEYLDYCYFKTEIGLFDEYIERYKKIKLESKGAKRELAKLFLNNLYGKMSTNDNSSFKLAYVKDNGVVSFISIDEHEKQVGYIPIGSAITSYARRFTITAAQKNFYGANKKGFVYADTDSIHCDLKPEEIQGITVHDKNFCCWKLESCWDKGIFVRQKTYIEHNTHEDLKPIEKPYYNIKCAGMNEKCKQMFAKSINGYVYNPDTPDTDEEKEMHPVVKEWFKQQRTLEDFKVGLEVVGNLKSKTIKGGTLLVENIYKMR